jgi:hypothetical protein
MGFLPIFYVAIFFVLAFVGYIFCHAMAKAMQVRWRVFWAILAFGATSYVGFIVVILVVGHSPLAFLLKGTFGTATYVLAYVLPGVAGVRLCLQGLKLLTPST